MLRSVSSYVLNSSKDGDFTTSVGNLFRSLTTFKVKKYFHVFKQSFQPICAHNARSKNTFKDGPSCPCYIAKKSLEKNWVSLLGDFLCHFGQILLYAVAMPYPETPLKPLAILHLTFCKKPVCSEKPCVHTEQASCRKHYFKGNHTSTQPSPSSSMKEGHPQHNYTVRLTLLFCSAVKLTASHFQFPVKHCRFVTPDARVCAVFSRTLLTKMHM